MMYKSDSNWLYTPPETPLYDQSMVAEAKRSEEESPRRNTSEDRVRREAQLDAYIAAFLGTDQEFIREFEEAGIESWRKADSVDKR